MAQIWVDIQPGVLDDFSLLGDWVGTPTVIDLGGAYAIEVDETASTENKSPRSLIYDPVGLVSDADTIEIYAEITAREYTSGSGNNTAIGPTAQQTIVNTSTPDNQLGVSGREDGENVLFERVSGNFDFSFFDPSSISTIDNTHRLRLRIEASSFLTKAWESGNTEPTSFEASRTRPSLPDGENGITIFRSGRYEITALSFGTDGDTAPTEPVAGGELVSLTSIDTIWTEDIADPKVSIGSSVSEVTATDDSPPGAALDLLALLYDNGVLSDEELAKLKALGTTEDQILLSDNAELFFRLQRFLEDRAEFDDGAEMILSAIASARDGVTFGGVFVPSIADIIIAVVQSTMMVGTTTKATADALDMVTDSVSLNDTLVAEVLRLAGDVILENTAFSSQVASKLVALVRTTTNLTMSELIESNANLRMKIYENVGLNDGAFSRLTDILWLAAEISIRLKTIGDVSINPDE